MEDRQKMIAALKVLIKDADGVERSVKRLEAQIGRAAHRLAAGVKTTHNMAILNDRRHLQLRFTLELGDLQGRIAELAGNIEEHDERERQGASERNIPMPPVPEDYLDWLRPALDEEDFERFEKEEFERLSADYLDWMKR